ncbi:TolC family outer membrane protein [Geopseudomonas aromaticivorans]|nr:TolC family outer membrane protein [Pseudomonas aromaticivorans]
MSQFKSALYWLAMMTTLGEPLQALAHAPQVHSGAAAERTRDGQAVVDLWQLSQEATFEDQRILAARARNQSSQWRKREALGQLLPQVNASGSFSRSEQETEQNRLLYNGDRYMLGLSQALYDPKIWHNYRRFSALAQQQAAEYEATREAATVDLIERYFMVLAAEDQLELVRAELRTTQHNLDRVNALYSRQLAMITDTLEMSARVDALEAAEIKAHNTVATSREALSELVGHSLSGQLKRIGEQANFYPPAQGLEYWEQQAMASNPTLLARQKAVDAAQASLRQAKSGHLPSVNLNLAAQRSDIGYENSMTPRTDTYVASVGVMVPIYSGGSTSAQVSSTYEDLMTAEHELEAVRREVIRETRTAYSGMEAGLNKIAASRKALESARKSRQAAEKAFGFGMMNAVDVLNTVKEEYATHRDLLKSQYDFIMNIMVLRRWSGTLVNDDVRKVNEWLVSPDEPQTINLSLCADTRCLPLPSSSATGHTRHP